MARLATFWDKRYVSPEFGTRAFGFDVTGSGSVHIIFTRNGEYIYGISLNAGRHERWFDVSDGDSVCAEGEASEDLIKNKICVKVLSSITTPITKPLIITETEKQGSKPTILGTDLNTILLLLGAGVAVMYFLGKGRR